MSWTASVYFQDMRIGTQGTKLQESASPAKWRVVKPSHFPSFLPHVLLSLISFCLFFSPLICFLTQLPPNVNLQGFTRSSMLAPHCKCVLLLNCQREISLPQLRGAVSLSPINCKQGAGLYAPNLFRSKGKEGKAFIPNQFLQNLYCVPGKELEQLNFLWLCARKL